MKSYIKKLYVVFSVAIVMLSCVNKKNPKVECIKAEASKLKKDSTFMEITDFPLIKDSIKFIFDLQQIFNLEVDESQLQEDSERVTVYKKVKLYGSDQDYFFIEYDYVDGCGAAFPWKYQLLLNSKGQLIKIMSGIRFEFVKIFENENPFLIIVTSTSKGNGGHSIYQISNGALENVYQSNLDYFIRTYDKHQDNMVNEPNELTLKIKDFNTDGFNDISFNGKFVLIKRQDKHGDWYDGESIDGIMVKYSIDNPFKKIPVELVFLYDQKTGHFKAEQNYSKVYKLEH